MQNPSQAQVQDHDSSQIRAQPMYPGRGHQPDEANGVPSDVCYSTTQDDTSMHVTALVLIQNHFNHFNLHFQCLTTLPLRKASFEANPALQCRRKNVGLPRCGWADQPF